MSCLLMTTEVFEFQTDKKTSGGVLKAAVLFVYFWLVCLFFLALFLFWYLDIMDQMAGEFE